MNIQEFLQNYGSIYTSEQYKVVVFKGYEYTPLFFSVLLKQLKKEKTVHVISDEVDATALFAQLSTSFLGAVGLYWLGDISSRKPSQQKKILQFLEAYQGPHQVMAYIPEKLSLEPAHGCIIELAKEYDYNSVKAISGLYAEKNMAGIIYFLRALFQRKKMYSLEELCLLLQYQSVLGKNKDLFLDQWFSKLTVDDHSLFHLSELFFAKRHDEFVRYWNELFDQYSEMFWVSYWSDQMFKAYCYIFQKQQGKVVSKYETYGLPFSFLRTDWKRHDLALLQQCHQKIYQIDMILKSGGNSRSMFTAVLSFL